MCCTIGPVPVAVVEAKDAAHTVSHGMQQALGYAAILNVPSAFSSNGEAFAGHNQAPQGDEAIETEFSLEPVLAFIILIMLTTSTGLIHFPPVPGAVRRPGDD